MQDNSVNNSAYNAQNKNTTSDAHLLVVVQSSKFVERIANELTEKLGYNSAETLGKYTPDIVSHGMTSQHKYEVLLPNGNEKIFSITYFGENGVAENKKILSFQINVNSENAQKLEEMAKQLFGNNRVQLQTE